MSEEQLGIMNSGRIGLEKDLCCPVAAFSLSGPCSAAGCSVGGRMSRQHPSLSLPTPQ